MNSWFVVLQVLNSVRCEIMNDKNLERKPSYMEAVAGDTTRKQAELLSFEKKLSSSDPDDAFANHNPGSGEQVK